MFLPLHSHAKVLSDSPLTALNITKTQGSPPNTAPSPYTTPSPTPDSAASSLCRSSPWGALFAACPSFPCQNLGNSNNNTNTESHPKSFKLFLRYCACESVARTLLPRPSSYSFYYSSQRRKINTLLSEG